MTGIYKIENLINHKVYIGKSVNIKKRWKEHIYLLNKNNHINPYLQNAWNKYGPEQFEFKIIELCPLSTINEREIYWINYYGGIDSLNTYNVTKGGYGGAGNDEWRKKISETVKKHYKNGDYPTHAKGMLVWVKKDKEQHKICKEQLDNYIKRGWQKGKLPLPEEALKRMRGKPGTMLGKHHTEESKAKMRKKHNISEKVHNRLSKCNSKKFKKLKWINNGKENKRVENVNDYINIGWKIGRISLPQIGQSLKKRYINNPELRYWGANARQKKLKNY